MVAARLRGQDDITAGQQQQEEEERRDTAGRWTRAKGMVHWQRERGGGRKKERQLQNDDRVTSRRLCVQGNKL